MQSLYSNIKSKIEANNVPSALFPSFSGVSQGENLSPILFALYLNDPHSFLRSRNVNGITFNEKSDRLLVYLRYSYYCMQMIQFCLATRNQTFNTLWVFSETYCKTGN